MNKLLKKELRLTAAPITYCGDTLPIWTDVSGKRTLVYLMDEKTSAQGFYLFSQTTGVQSPYLPSSAAALLIFTRTFLRSSPPFLALPRPL